MKVDNSTLKVDYNCKLFNNQQEIQKYIHTICARFLSNVFLVAQLADP